MTPPFTLHQLIAKVREIANREPDYVYGKFERGFPVTNGCGSECRYLDSTNVPGRGCIFGIALLELGVSKETIAEKFEGCIIRIALNDNGFPYGQELDWCASVQREQDNGFSWGQAVSRADHEYPLTPNSSGSEVVSH